MEFCRICALVCDEFFIVNCDQNFRIVPFKFSVLLCDCVIPFLFRVFPCSYILMARKTSSTVVTPLITFSSPS
jgi:hypothetical protein